MKKNGTRLRAGLFHETQIRASNHQRNGEAAAEQKAILIDLLLRKK